MGISHVLFPKILRLSYGSTLEGNQLTLRFLYVLTVLNLGKSRLHLN